ncbi:kinase-like domain-containing protein [Fomitopsis serialis]|uniref:kinase-like domain-containing protein n=1 Tax=Fomitopsis serialis TaxID=139415 RepID=UPI0020085BC3|nr:kinase-like domain-containing protein [Neoantrodia serialis]KAH9921347.1 kinase-like domain-containing protein [Neoantrodia serialis]
MALHAVGIVHCNINPSVLLIENGCVVIADFGYAQIGMDSLTRSVRKKPHRQRKGEVEPYQAPELLLDWSPHVASDWWGFGLVLYYMLTAKQRRIFLLSSIRFCMATSPCGWLRGKTAPSVTCFASVSNAIRHCACAAKA